MSIYEKSTVELMRQFVAERPGQESFTAEEIRAWFEEHWPKINRKTVDCHIKKMTINDGTRVHFRAHPGKDDLFFRIGPGVFRRYCPERDPKPIYPGESEVVDDGDEGIEADSTFAYEDHLRDYLARNLHTLETGLQLYEAGIEYPIRNRRIDLLAVGQDGAFVVIELKVSRGHERTVGQLLTYMGWVRKDLANGRPVRGIIVAHELTEELITAVQESGGKISLFEYEISLQVRPVPTDG